MATSPQSEDVQVLNLMFLLTLQKGCSEDPARASAVFGLSAEEAERLKGLSLEAVQALAGSMNECVAALRFSASDLVSIAPTPAPFRPIRSALHESSSRRHALAA